MTVKDYFKVQDDPHAPINVRFGGWCSDWPSGSAWFPHLLASDGDLNLAHFSSSSVDSAIDRIAGLPLGQQPSAWGAFDKEIMTTYYPEVVVSYTGVAMPHGASIGGMNDNVLLGTPTWKDLYIRH
jgi:peptide/nickel transport system substrate-binding protein